MDRYIRILFFASSMIWFETLSDAAYTKGNIPSGIALFLIAFLFGYWLYKGAYHDGKNDAKKKR